MEFKCLFLLSLVLVSTFICCHSEVIRNSGPLSANFGQTTYIQKSDLRIKPGSQSSDCSVKVLYEETSFSSRIGRLFPSQFSCNYKEGSVYYEHYGSSLLNHTAVKLLVTYFTNESERVSLPVYLKVDILPASSSPFNCIVRNLGLTAGDASDFSNPISSSNLAFLYNRSREECTISVLNGAAPYSWPRYGNIVNESSVYIDAGCDSFLSSQVTYRRTAISSPKADYLHAVVTIRNASNSEIVKKQWFFIPITIEDGTDNQPPHFSETSLLQLSVNQFMITALNTSILSALDDFTPTQDLIFIIAEDEFSGDIVSTDDIHLQIESFTQADLMLLKIAYKPPSQDSDEIRIVRVPLYIMDGEGLTSTNTFDLTVTVRPMDTLSPLVVKNIGLRLHEGERGRITSRSNLQIADEDNLEEVKLTVEYGLNHGSLIAPNSQSYFTVADLNDGIVYVHDGSNTLTDNIIFKASDGQHEIEFLFPVMVFPVDDTAPILLVNTGLQVFKGLTVQITPIHLRAHDEDSEDSLVTFTLEQPYSAVGHLVLHKKLPTDTRNWRQVGQIWEKVVTSWTQRDIDNGYLNYKYTASAQNLPMIDTIKFKLRDDNSPPNISPSMSFEVKVLQRDVEAPTPSIDASFHLTVLEGQITVLEDTVLRYVDAGSQDKDIIYSVTLITSLSDAQLSGDLVYSDRPDVTVSEFTQAELSKGKISYKPAFGEIGIIPHLIQVTFDVKDSSGNAETGQFLTVFVQPINNQPPVVVVKPLQVFENGYVIIMPSHLDAADADTSDESLTFTVERPPRNGKLKLQGVDVKEGSKFSKTDIFNGGVVYTSSTSGATTDSILIDVSDGMHHIPVHVRVRIVPVDDGFPTYEDGEALVYNLNVEEGTVSYLPSNMIPSQLNDLVFTLSHQPIRGVVSPQSFTLENLKNDTVSYSPLQVEIGAEPLYDTFNLTVSEGQLFINRKIVSEILVHVSILPVDNTPPVLSLGSSFEVVEGGSAAILPSNLQIIDVDSASEDVVCSITIQPQYGYLELSSPAPGSEYPRTGQPITAFKLLDINKGNVNYKQSIYEGVEPASDSFHISCSDGINTGSQGLTFNIDIIPVNDEKPRIFVNDFVVEEGRFLLIDLPILNVIDHDFPQDHLKFKVLTQPVNGKILESTSVGAREVTEFNFNDIRLMSKISYKHSGTETTNDSLVLQVTDGKHTATKKIPIQVIAVDDEVPQLHVNTGLYIEAAVEAERPEWKYITNTELRAEDLDSPNGNISFRIRQQPVFGFLQRRVDQLGHSWDNITRHMTFQQWEIDENIIRYVHNGRYGVRDVIKLDISDRQRNSQINQRFYVSVEPLDMVYPDVVNRGVELPTNQSVILTTDMLSAWDDKSSAESITFTVTAQPQNGRLELITSPGRKISTFTQIDLVAGRVQYTHTGSSRQASDAFEFEVTDGFNPLHRAFSISIIPADNQLPILMIQPIRLREKGSTYITPSQLTARDRDTASDSLTFTVTQPPLFGSILLSGQQTTQFTQDHLENGLITYKHMGPEASNNQVIEDSFKVKVTDGTHNRFYVYPNLNTPVRRPQKVTIYVAAVDDSIPQLITNRPITNLKVMPAFQRLGMTLNSQNLKVTDKDTSNDYIMYWLIDRPGNGQLIKDGQPVNMWTQVDIDNGLLTYLLNDGVEDTNDHFTFRIQDGGGNDIPSTLFTLTWSYVSFKHATVVVNETDAVANVILQRRGSLTNTVFVSVNVRDITTARHQDYSGNYAQQVQFNPGEYEKTWRLEVINDDEYEVKEMLTLELSNPVGTILESHEWTTLAIVDPDDQPTVALASPGDIEVNENVGRASIKIKRTGDINTEVIAVCDYREGTTRGTNHPALYTDFILRSSAARFTPGQDTAYCYVDIIDDTYVEPAEFFDVFIKKVEGGAVGHPNSTRVTILKDESDLPKISFQTSAYNVTEGEGSVTVIVERKGGDITQQSIVLVTTKRYNYDKAEPLSDYMPISKSLTFSPGEMLKEVKVTILDDRSMPMVEGRETFQLLLSLPDNALVADPNHTTIAIEDEVDIPKFAFTASRYEVSESNGTLTVTVGRYGDVSTTSTIQCVSTTITASQDVDFIARRSGSALSTVTFQPGERETSFDLTIINDSIYEGDETFKLMILTGDVEDEVKTAIVTITDDEDEPVIGFADTHVYTSEPSSNTSTSTARIVVERRGDLSRVSIVTVHTKEGSATNGVDYIDLTRELEFGPGVKERVVEVTILYDGEPELRKNFFVLLSSDSNGVASLDASKCSVYITDEGSVTGLIFPVDPVVVSLKDYDNVDTASTYVNGYPLICVTPCDPRHPEYSRTKVICDNEGIDNAFTTYRWKVGAPVGRNGVTIDLQTASSDSFIATTKVQTLESIYFGPGSRVQCVATACSNSLYQGLERESGIVTISSTEGICKPRRPGFSGDEPYLTKVKYLGKEHKRYENFLKLSVSIPHRDGMLPTISTEKLTNFEYMLSPSASRVGLHRCSNLVWGAENSLSVGWRESKKANEAIFPYQYDRELREDKSVGFYSNLDLENCMWQFHGFFKISELLNVCGAVLETSGQSADLTESYLSLVIPIYVSYVFHSPSAPGGWLHYDLVSNQRITFVYDTAMLLTDGVSNIQADQGASSFADVSGTLFLHSVKIQTNGHLVVEFQTQPNFYGQFIMEEKVAQSSVTSHDHLQLTFQLQLIQSENTFDNPKQTWQFVSDSAVQDYTGSYIVKLIPCVVPVDTSYSADAVCTAQQPLTFYLDIELQQVSDPVAKIFSLNTELTLTRNKRAWVTNNRTGELAIEVDLSDVAFQSGERIYGRVDTRELNDTALPHEVFVEKVYVCAGKNGFVPKYAPDSQEYGCAAMTGDLQAQYKILDKTNPDSVTKLLNGIPFNAKFAADDKRGKQIHNMPGTDGFMFDSKPLNAELERKWFVHVIYSVDTLTNPLKMIRRFRRAQLTELSGVGHAKGTNMAFLYLTEPSVSSASAKSSPESPTYTWAVAVGVITLLLVLVTLGISLVTVKIIKLKKKKQNRLKESERRDGPESLPMHVDEKRDASISDSIDGDAVVKLNATVTNSEI